MVKRLNSGAESTGNIGAGLELFVAARMIQAGYHVYRALAMTSPCDLIAQKDGLLIRVEVTRGYRNLNGKVSYPPHDPGRFDILVLGFKDGSFSFYRFINGVLTEILI